MIQMSISAFLSSYDFAIFLSSYIINFSRMERKLSKKLLLIPGKKKKKQTLESKSWRDDYFAFISTQNVFYSIHCFDFRMLRVLGEKPYVFLH